MSTLTIPFVRLADGSVDQDKTLENAAKAIRNYIVERETEETVIAEKVAAVFDQYKGAVINMPALTSFTLQKMEASPDTFKALSERIGEYVRSHAGERDSGALFHIGKGKGGGCLRWADQPEPKPEAAK